MPFFRKPEPTPPEPPRRERPASPAAERSAARRAERAQRIQADEVNASPRPAPETPAVQYAPNSRTAPWDLPPQDVEMRPDRIYGQDELLQRLQEKNPSVPLATLEAARDALVAQRVKEYRTYIEVQAGLVAKDKGVITFNHLNVATGESSLTLDAGCAGCSGSVETITFGIHRGLELLKAKQLEMQAADPSHKAELQWVLPPTASKALIKSQEHFEAARSVGEGNFRPLSALEVSREISLSSLER